MLWKGYLINGLQTGISKPAPATHIIRMEGKMHTDHSKKEEGIIGMVISNGLFLIGRLVGGNKLIDPRVFNIIDDGKRIQMSPLPGTPPFLTLGNDKMGYAIPETTENQNILDLYHKVTRPQPESPFLVKPTPTTPDINGQLN
jgi:hypothetical protein